VACHLTVFNEFPWWEFIENFACWGSPKPVVFRDQGGPDVAACRPCFSSRCYRPISLVFSPSELWSHRHIYPQTSFKKLAQLVAKHPKKCPQSAPYIGGVFFPKRPLILSRFLSWLLEGLFSHLARGVQFSRRVCMASNSDNTANSKYSVKSPKSATENALKVSLKAEDVASVKQTELTNNLIPFSHGY